MKSFLESDKSAKEFILVEGNKRFKVKLDEIYRGSDTDRYTLGDFNTLEEAIQKAIKIYKEENLKSHKRGDDPKVELYIEDSEKPMYSYWLVKDGLQGMGLSYHEVNGFVVNPKDGEVYDYTR